MAFWKQTALYGGVALLAGALGFAVSQRMHTHAPEAEAPAPAAGAVEGKPAADLTLPDLAGKPRSLSEWRGQWLLVNFWATWCAPCMAEIPVLIAAQTRYAPQGLKVLGIAMDDPEAVQATVKAKGFNYPTLVGDEAVATGMEQLGNTLGALPYTVLISPEGVVRQVELGGIDEAKITVWMQEYLPAAK